MSGKSEKGPSFKAKLRHKKTYEIFDQINWPLTSLMISAHSIALYSLIRIVTGQTHWKTLLFHFVLGLFINSLGCVAGHHRLWSHRAFKAKLPLRIFLMILSTLSGQGPIYLWARWHRQHHKYSDTPADPHDPRRGFFYAHIGWFFLYDHEKFLRNSKDEIFTADLERDEVVMWQSRNYNWFVVLAGSIPAAIPWIMGWENIVNSFAFSSLTAVYLVHLAGLVNSFAHSSWGTRPYDKNMHPSRISFLSLLLSGEGDHNYHHTFPWDYKSAEQGTIWNFAMYAIHFFHWIGLAHDLRFASPEMAAKRAERTGDGSLRKMH